MNKMILIADSGSTKTDWVVVQREDGRVVATIQTQGISPVHQSPEVIREIIGQELVPQLPCPLGDGSISHFYGSGCSPQWAPVVERQLREAFPRAAVTVLSDMVGAARGLCGRREGIACILGTGANSGLYDGERIVQDVPSLGYILGDEGSGAVLGRLFVNAIFLDERLAAVRDDFLAEQQLTLADIIRRVYREPLANRFLASTSLYIGRHLDNSLLRQLVTDNFRQFFRRYVAPYQRADLPVHFVGSMAYHYREQLCEAATAEGFVLGQVVKSPMEGLVRYHAMQDEQ